MWRSFPDDSLKMVQRCVHAARLVGAALLDFGGCLLGGGAAAAKIDPTEAMRHE
jgi:hypothetical protein